MATLKHVADAAGVSLYTASKVLSGQARQGRISDDRARQVTEVARRLGYRRNSAARTMRQQRSMHIGVVVPNHPGDRYTHPMAYEMVLGINEGLQPVGYIMSLVRVTDVQKNLADSSRVFGEQVLDGMIVLDAMPTHVEEHIQELVPAAVWADSNVWRPTGCLRRDERAAGRLVAEAALDLCYREAAWITNIRPSDDQYRHHYSGDERYAGVMEVLEPAGVEPAHVIINDTITLDEKLAQLRPLLHRNAALLVNSVYQARELRTLCEGLGLRFGYDVGMLCCDDTHEFTRMWPGVSRATFDRYGFGLEAADMMLETLNGDSGDCPSRLVKPTWFPGNTAWGPETFHPVSP